MRRSEGLPYSLEDLLCRPEGLLYRLEDLLYRPGGLLYQLEGLLCGHVARGPLISNRDTGGSYVGQGLSYIG